LMTLPKVSAKKAEAETVSARPASPAKPAAAQTRVQPIDITLEAPPPEEDKKGLLSGIKSLFKK
jgi:hypothetical protein